MYKQSLNHAINPRQEHLKQALIKGHYHNHVIFHELMTTPLTTRWAEMLVVIQEKNICVISSFHEKQRKHKEFK
jgi:hypothetical protein